MSKQEILTKLASDLRSCADSISALAQAISMATDETATPTLTHPKQNNSLNPAPAVTLADVRSCLVELSRAGFTDKVRKLIQSHGADKLSDIDSSEYAAVLAEAGEMKNG